MKSTEITTERDDKRVTQNSSFFKSVFDYLAGSLARKDGLRGGISEPSFQNKKDEKLMTDNEMNEFGHKEAELYFREIKTNSKLS